MSRDIFPVHRSKRNLQLDECEDSKSTCLITENRKFSGVRYACILTFVFFFPPMRIGNIYFAHVCDSCSCITKWSTQHNVQSVTMNKKNQAMLVMQARVLSNFNNNIREIRETEYFRSCNTAQSLAIRNHSES